jgi:hypothetical protein
MIIHIFIFGAYSSSLLGGFISDSFLGATRFAVADTHAAQASSARSSTFRSSIFWGV